MTGIRSSGIFVGRCIALRSFLATSSVLMRAMRRSGPLPFEQTISNPKFFGE